MTALPPLTSSWRPTPCRSPRRCRTVAWQDKSPPFARWAQCVLAAGEIPASAGLLSARMPAWEAARARARAAEVMLTRPPSVQG